jgi:hypothetical protein
MARLTVARKIAAIVLTIWKKRERFDPEQSKRHRIMVDRLHPQLLVGVFPGRLCPRSFSLLADDFRTVLAVKGSLRRNQRRAVAKLVMGGSDETKFDHRM